MMPEGPEVRTLVDQLQPLVGLELVDFRVTSGRYLVAPDSDRQMPTLYSEFMSSLATSGDNRILSWDW
jgi:formamidopyrimidine-DNA glycosylase